MSSRQLPVHPFVAWISVGAAAFMNGKALKAQSV